MKSKSNELLDKSISAMIAAIEVYNKPDFLYRGETFSILAINSWELLLKAKHLKDNHNKMRSLYVMEPVINKDGRTGCVLEVFLASPTNKIIRVKLDKEYLVPVYSPMLVSINKKEKKIQIDIK